MKMTKRSCEKDILKLKNSVIEGAVILQQEDKGETLLYTVEGLDGYGRHGASTPPRKRYMVSPP